MKSDLLTIIIPTRNRVDLLKEYLEELVVTAGRYGVLVVVSDNCSTDETRSLTEVLSLAYNNFSVVNQDVSLSIDESMIASVAGCRTKYFMWLGDDDRLHSDAIKYVLETLLNEEPDILLLNMGEVSEGDKTYKASIKLENDKLYKDALQFFCEHAFNLPFGSFVLRIESYKLEFYERYMGTSHAYSGMVFDYLAWLQKRGVIKAIVSSRSYVCSKKVEKSWSSNRARIMLYEIPKWFDLLEDYYYPSSLIVRNQYLRKWLTFHGIFRAFRPVGQIKDFNDFDYFSPVQKRVVSLLKRLVK